MELVLYKIGGNIKSIFTGCKWPDWQSIVWFGDGSPHFLTRVRPPPPLQTPTLYLQCSYHVVDWLIYFLFDYRKNTEKKIRVCRKVLAFTIADSTIAKVMAFKFDVFLLFGKREFLKIPQILNYKFKRDFWNI